jgi:hypothetical protein
MLDAFTPEEFDERYVAETMDASPHDMVERLATILKLGFAAMAMSKVDPDHFDPLKPIHNNGHSSSPFGGVFDGDSSAKTSTGDGVTVSPNQGAAMFAAVMGPPTPKGF